MLAGQTKTILAPFGKTLDKAAFQKLVEMTGFDLRMFTGNLEKLVQYVGDRKTIAVEDVESALPRTRQDPVFELTNAVTDRNYEAGVILSEIAALKRVFPASDHCGHHQSDKKSSDRKRFPGESGRQFLADPDLLLINSKSSSPKPFCLRFRPMTRF